MEEHLLKGEHRYPAAIACLVAVALYITLPNKFLTGPVWVLPAIVIFLLVPLLTTSWRRHAKEEKWQRYLSILLIAVINLYNLFSLGTLINVLIHPNGSSRLGVEVLLAAVAIWFTNVIVFGLWYWELDRGGPAKRPKESLEEADFLFPQMTTPQVAPKHWHPHFIDYIYVSFTNATAFSPTDTLPLSRWAKILMAIESIISLTTVALVAARAVNILS